MTRFRRTLVAVLLFLVIAIPSLADDIHHYIFIGHDREKLAEPGFLDHKGVEGVQVKYTWRQLEQGKDNYAFDDLHADLKLVQAKGKKLFLQVQDATFGLEWMPVPKYLREDPEYHGGVEHQSTFPDGKPEEAKPYGWVARRWDPAVRDRFHKLLAALGKEFDGEIEGINLPESAIDIPYAGKMKPEGYTREGYRDALLETMAALKQSFPKSNAMMYANFMPEVTTDGEPRMLRSLYERAAELKLGMGGPDLLPHRKWQLYNSYPLIKEFSAKIPMGIAVQDGNLADINPQTHNPVTVEELATYARDELHVKYIFWGTQEPYFTRDVLPYLDAK